MPDLPAEFPMKAPVRLAIRPDAVTADPAAAVVGHP